MPNEKNKITEAAVYDKLFREISPVFLKVFVEKVLRLNIIEYTELKDKLQVTRQKETDTLRKVKDSEGNVFILQVEIQTSNNSKMAIQMADYWVLLHQIHKLPIKQYVLYVGHEPLSMPDRLEQPNFNSGIRCCHLPICPTICSLAPNSRKSKCWHYWAT